MQGTEADVVRLPPSTERVALTNSDAYGAEMTSTMLPVPIKESSLVRYCSSLKGMLRKAWPWLVLALMVIPAVWHVADFEEDVDAEFPTVVRPTLSRVPPSAYRLAEPGDTLDRIMIYMSAASVVLAASGLLLHRGGGLWHAGLALSLAGLWYSATPGPAVDGWYGLGWRSMFDPQARCKFAAGCWSRRCGSRRLRRDDVVSRQASAPVQGPCPGDGHKRTLGRRFGAGGSPAI